MILLMVMLASPPPMPVESEARRVVEAQLRAAPRVEDELSAEEAARIRQLYREAIGQRVERAADAPR
ncbi:hypothetical protein [Sphingobium estronivorans]|uniref:hypothetical protein n=1 Tax=Sphingobium estronivorans TaxID=1577690 RepID=UPI001239B78C|nr:hypothetical protein [Sphingobium estronivorans]